VAGIEKAPLLNIFDQMIAKHNFDFTIIGRGACGLPFGSFVKQMGCQAIRLGGLTQLLFGIRGNRWDNRESYARFIDETSMPAERRTPGRCRHRRKVLLLVDVTGTLAGRCRDEIALRQARR
jgi:hypothetical protein